MTTLNATVSQILSEVIIVDIDHIGVVKVLDHRERYQITTKRNHSK